MSREVKVISETVDGDKKTVVQEVIENGVKKQVTSVFLLKTRTRALPQSVVARRKWAKFGLCREAAPGPEPQTTSIADDVFIELCDVAKKEEKQQDDQKASQSKGISCRHCGGPHWTASCPYTEYLSQGNTEENQQEEESMVSTSTKGKYVPPSERMGRTSSSYGGNTDEEDTAIKISNLHEDTTEPDVRELCKPFGRISRVYLAVDRRTGKCKDYAFVTFSLRSEAAAAIKGLYRYPFGSLILEVDWKPARKPRY